jgi:hypothetical protein
VLRENIEEELKEVERRIEIMDLDYSRHLNIWSIKKNPQIHRCGQVCRTQRERVPLLAERENLLATRARLDRILNRRLQLVAESQSDEAAISVTKQDYHENVSDIGGMESYETTSGISSGPSIGQVETLVLAEFFRRPVEIDNFEVKVGDTIFANYPIWDLYTLDPTVRAKLRNYAYLRANMKVRIAISGSPFHMGKLLVSYQPYARRNKNILANETQVGADPNGMMNFHNYLSQAPGAVVMDIRLNKPVEMLCPFISTKPMHRLYNSAATAIAATTSYVDLEDAGELFICSLNPVAAVSETATPISVQIYAWMEDVQLGCTTATHLEIVAESDERHAGPVERISSAAATVADALVAIPQISALAKASSMVLKGVSRFAALFGWSRPLMIQQPQLMKNRPFCNGSQTVGAETVEKISLDPMQELTVDPSVVGVQHDELTLKYLTERESFVTQFIWDDTADILADPIFLCKVNPFIDTFFDGLAYRYIQPSALSFASQPFMFWRGKIKFRFEFVVSAFHRGKLAFFFEPNLHQRVLINADLSMNKNFMHVVDIQETQNIEFCVNWAQPRAWLQSLPEGTSYTNYGTGFTDTTYDNGYSNGYIGVTAFTELQSPDGSGIYVNVYVSGEDMQYNVLSEENLPQQRHYVAESITQGAMNDNSISCIELNTSSAQPSQVCDYHFGEQPLSLRGCLKRYVTTYYVSDDEKTAHYRTTVTRPIWNVASPALGGTISTPATLIEYLPYAFLGVRGSVRKRVRAWTDSGQGYSSRTHVGLSSIASSLTSALSYSIEPARSYQKGTVQFVPATNGGIEVDIPYYSNNLFGFSFADDFIGANGTDDMETDWYKNYIIHFDNADPTATATKYIQFTEETAAGEDFTFMRFQGAPMYSATL